MALLLLGVATGCVEKTVFPSVLVNVRSVTPYRQEPTGTAGAYTVQDVSVALQVESAVPSKLVGYTVDYATNLGDVLPQLRIPRKDIEQYLTPSGANTFTVKVYTDAVLELYQNSPSRLGPISVTITMFIHDVNGNDIQREGHCLLDPPPAG